MVQANEEDHVADVEETDEEEYHNNLVELVAECMKWKENEYVAVVYQNQWYPGCITKVNGHTVEVNVMHRMMTGKNNFKWPKSKDEIPYLYDDVLCVIDPPKPSNQRGEFCLDNDDFLKANALLCKYS